jgi:CRISPR-associated endonuclease/helicase Cas3
MSSGLNFAQVFSELTGHQPFPWQRQLYDDWFAKEKFPAVCDIPTGLGKTSVVAVWLIALAKHPDLFPRRLVYVVNRRTVVDQTTHEVKKLRDNIHESDLNDPLSKLCAIPLANHEPALAISTLRGQFADNREWLADPARPAVIVGTVDMIGSRLLFNGYRAGSWQLARHAGLVGHDVLLVHDEAHLEPSFQRLINWIVERQKNDGSPRPLRVMAMSATSRASARGGVLKLSDQDLKDPRVQRRFNQVAKHQHLHEHGLNTRLPDQLTELAWRHADAHARVIVYVRQPESSGKVRDGLLAKLKGQTGAVDRVALLTGTIRGHERDLLIAHPAVDGLLHSNDEEGKRISPNDTTWLVATSAGEVGSDFDADHLVCDLAPLDSMIQRFGRVNRRGGEGRVAQIDVVLDRPQTKMKDGKVKQLPKLDQVRLATADLLTKLPLISGATDAETNTSPRRNASPDALRNLAESFPDEYSKACCPEPPSVTPHDVVLDAWALTSVQDDWPLCHDVHPYLHGLDPQAPETVVAWRTELDELPHDEVTAPENIVEIMRDVLRHYPLRPLELLREKPQAVTELLVAARERVPKAWIILLHQRSQLALRLEYLEGDAKTIAPQLHYRTVLLPPSLGGLNPAGMLEVPDPKAAQVVAVRDVADLSPSINGVAQPSVRRRVVLTRDDEYQWRAHVLSGACPADASCDGEIGRTYPKWTAARDALSKSLNMTYESQCLLAKDDAGPTRRLLLFQARAVSSMANSIQRITIASHNTAVAHLADKITAAVKLDELLRHAFFRAAGHHDLGKRDSRWQAAIGNGEGHDRLAKSCGHGFNWRTLNGYRHEFGSLRAIAEDLPDDEARELALHLVAAHHGRGRPHFDLRAMADENGLSDNLHELLQPAEVARRFARLQRRYGHWGLAWLESILMAADAAGSQMPVDVAADEVEEDEE